jgi:hypothetical protein
MSVLSVIWGAISGFWNSLPGWAKGGALAIVWTAGVWVYRGDSVSKAKDAEWVAKIDSAKHQVTATQAPPDTSHPSGVFAAKPAPFDSTELKHLRALVEAIGVDTDALHERLIGLLLPQVGRLDLGTWGHIDVRYDPAKDPLERFSMLGTSDLIAPGPITIHDNAMVPIPAKGTAWWQDATGFIGAACIGLGAAKKNGYMASLGGIGVGYWLSVKFNL